MYIKIMKTTRDRVTYSHFNFYSKKSYNGLQLTRPLHVKYFMLLASNTQIKAAILKRGEDY